MVMMAKTSLPPPMTTTTEMTTTMMPAMMLGFRGMKSARRYKKKDDFVHSKSTLCRLTSK